MADKLVTVEPSSTILRLGAGQAIGRGRQWCCTWQSIRRRALVVNL